MRSDARPPIRHYGCGSLVEAHPGCREGGTVEDLLDGLMSFAEANPLATAPSTEGSEEQELREENSQLVYWLALT